MIVNLLRRFLHSVRDADPGAVVAPDSITSSPPNFTDLPVLFILTSGQFLLSSRLNLMKLSLRNFPSMTFGRLVRDLSNK